ncbi:MAG: tRNA 2-thiouridine(34) synthase MnmA [Candidatus Yonathbacteria bacterium CG10_big_fil_rev_8_21_14_0_10_43_136]|uniref:tRNA-specific 2-thiouridylase MnmA n=2 Tax=Parcubacteria group TaxID=1794811 RepID=A0A2M7Q5M3_9BACT|nr:MAG: tRNA 2-thiouridine(34) synthase MnmA [Candidatus Yonathbacteria bacterium CG17_big_fil_post_rev_8_21_14_2_50_43_9]PIR40910.1 MAG: tRNA 2-thiouridine(34) synthase MnmA [Candidatus Yonathbacteria bacterium CG10_big_fil_rev_8_21_14_0_10_43_136]PIX57551.1 MAG: tRNA 2-thiouridine(34) synthase MnmA [Candidatus Yonathbacteria bacterium CG_4_10_14_3_um_filter_43_12]PIY58509.1 MAG: tRNA 2-thiouridine(34) synthase MnmA [Candidatus Yonathbacteria bacterium CG_4_10_14_0_8_um_filter_43_17]PJC21683.1
MKKKSKGRVYVGMSGGVDSSVSAALLQKAGYDVTGVFMKVWQPDFLPCMWREERLDAMRVSAHLGIPLLTWDFEKEYKEGVADYMIAEYKAGRTPNPDVMCNKEIKFGAFFRRAIKEGADFVATGHYAQVKYDKKTGIYEMLKGVDDAKDQSYFLWTLGQEQLRKTFFPIGGYKKSAVRALAKKFALPVAEKKDSQGLCFVGKLDMKDFLAHYIGEKDGCVLNEKGEAIGTHRGAYFYTLGERHGFTVTKKGTDDTPFYVVAKDFEKNTITVAHQLEGKSIKPLECASQELRADQASFCKGALPDSKRKYTAQVRYHGEQYKCKIIALNESGFFLRLERPAVFDAGQSVVLCDGNECLGGGIITT